jgi:hypothetical protein
LWGGCGNDKENEVRLLKQKIARKTGACRPEPFARRVKTFKFHSSHFLKPGSGHPEKRRARAMVRPERVRMRGDE